MLLWFVALVVVTRRRKGKVPGDGDNLAETVDVDVLVLVDLGKELVEGGVHGC